MERKIADHALFLCTHCSGSNLSRDALHVYQCFFPHIYVIHRDKSCRFHGMLLQVCHRPCAYDKNDNTMDVRMELRQEKRPESSFRRKVSGTVRMHTARRRKA